MQNSAQVFGSPTKTCFCSFAEAGGFMWTTTSQASPGSAKGLGKTSLALLLRPPSGSAFPMSLPDVPFSGNAAQVTWLGALVGSPNLTGLVVLNEHIPNKLK